MAYENAAEKMEALAGAQALAASRRIGFGVAFGGHGGKGHGAAIIGLEAYSHKND